MATALQDPNIFYLAVILLAALGLGTGLSLGKGGALLAKLKGNGEGKVSVSVTPAASAGTEKAGKSCSECLQNLAQMLPCKDHSGVVAGIGHLAASNDRIEKRVDQVWDAIDDIRDDVKTLIKSGRPK
jgi:hypothetical protein